MIGGHQVIGQQDTKVVCQAGLIMGALFLILGMIMMFFGSMPIPLFQNAAVLFVIVGGALTLISWYALEHTPATASAAIDEQRQWNRFWNATATVTGIYFFLFILGIRLDLSMELPLAILGIYLFWSYVYAKK
jgi:hypothetical protein